VHLVLSQATRLVVIGLTIGLVSSVFATRLLERFLFQVSAVDPWTYAWVALFLGGAAVVAATIPARRAIRIDPMEVLRTE
jgi:ABC-type antimicrobial peptide transport system permease subunit